MSVGEKLVARLEELMETEGLPAEPDQPLMLETRHGPVRLAAQVLGFDRVGCSFAEMAVHHSEPGQEGPSLKTRAERLVGTVTYLMEHLALIEIDEASQQALLRSDPPRRVDGAVEYYEALFNRTGDGALQVRLVRYRQDAGAQRRSIAPLNLTREVLQRLLSDLAEVTGPLVNSTTGDLLSLAP